LRTCRDACALRPGRQLGPKQVSPVEHCGTLPSGACIDGHRLAYSTSHARCITSVDLALSPASIRISLLAAKSPVHLACLSRRSLLSRLSETLRHLLSASPYRASISASHAHDVAHHDWWVPIARFWPGLIGHGQLPPSSRTRYARLWGLQQPLMALQMRFPRNPYRCVPYMAGCEWR
jgi:hypothetical protein